MSDPVVGCKIKPEIKEALQIISHGNVSRLLRQIIEEWLERRGYIEVERKIKDLSSLLP